MDPDNLLEKYEEFGAYLKTSVTKSAKVEVNEIIQVQSFLKHLISEAQSESINDLIKLNEKASLDVKRLNIELEEAKKREADTAANVKSALQERIKLLEIPTVPTVEEFPKFISDGKNEIKQMKIQLLEYCFVNLGKDFSSCTIQYLEELKKN